VFQFVERERERELNRKLELGVYQKCRIESERGRKREGERKIVLIRGGASSLCALRRGRKTAAAIAATRMMCYETKS